MYYKIMFMLLLFSSTLLHGQDDEDILIQGKIVTMTNGVEEGIPGARIRWKNDSHVALSANDGTFAIAVHHLPDTLYVKSTGYELVAFEIKSADQNYTINMSGGILLHGVEIVAESITKSIDLLDPFNVEKIGQDELRKAACCNLSESFETNASVDINMTDAISGAKKIQMLGLDGIYTQIQYENIPMVRGLSSSFGLNYTPGTWVESIQITKGTGSVVNGFESMAGLINIEFKDPEHGEAFYANFYGNKFARLEGNIHSAYKMSDRWGQMTFLHFSNFFIDSDVNKDGFRDFPIGQVGAFMHRWSYAGSNYETKFGIKANYNDQLGGQLNYNPESSSGLYQGIFKNQHVELFSKNGFFIEKRKFGNVGLIGQLEYHHLFTQLGNNTYDGTQKKFYFNGIYNDIISNTNHNYKTGLSFTADDYVQRYNDSLMLKTEIISGAFFEYTYNRLDKFILVAGLRGDYHNMYGPLFSPRLHIKWNFSPKNALRLSFGRGYRIPNPYADNVSFMASSRQWIVAPNIKPEDAISSGITFTQKFMIRDEVSTITLDYFYTHFLNQLVVDMDYAPTQLYIYSTIASAWSHSFQIELLLKPIKNFELRAAYKYYDVVTTYHGMQHQMAFVPKFRALFNVGYTTRNKKWSFDATGNWIGKKRLPDTSESPAPYQRGPESERYWIVNSQITYRYKKFNFYIGGENLLNVIQDNAIISADNPFGAFFDATQVWAPITGANVYVGFHYAIKQKDKE
ncbi:MAG: TonB-dependent receptor [Crocinitomicaceae bacterium]|nr:TonB-dependent receptor [Crocinitomicaceae bacterium]